MLTVDLSGLVGAFRLFAFKVVRADDVGCHRPGARSAGRGGVPGQPQVIVHDADAAGQRDWASIDLQWLVQVPCLFALLVCTAQKPDPCGPGRWSFR